MGQKFGQKMGKKFGQSLGQMLGYKLGLILGQRLGQKLGLHSKIKGLKSSWRIARAEGKWKLKSKFRGFKT